MKHGVLGAVAVMMAALLAAGVVTGQGIAPAKKPVVIKHRGLLEMEFGNLDGFDPDPDKMFSSLNEMISYDDEIFDYAVEKLQEASFLESISAAFLLGEIDAPDTPLRLLDLIKKRVVPVKKGLASPTVVSDGFLCISLGIQGSKLIANASQANGIVGDIRAHLRKLAAKPIWSEFWTHQFEVLLLAAAQDANVRMTTTAPGDVVVQESEAEALASFDETVEVACLG